MKLKTRRIIMFSFILAFFILAPILIFYSSGYRYDIKRHKVLKTGTLYLESKTLKKANLYINGKLYQQPFSEKKFIYNLLPGEYQLKLEKEGYYSWQKKVTINSSLTTFVKDIILFKKNIPLQLVDDQVYNFYLAPDNQRIIYLLATDSFFEFYLYDLLTNEVNLIYRLPFKGEINLIWSSSSKKFLAKIDNTYLIFEGINLKQSQEIKTITNFLPFNLKWDLQSDNFLYAFFQNAVYKIDLLSKTSQKIFESKDLKMNPEFFIEANDLFYIKEAENQNSLYKYNFNFKTNKKILELNKSTNYKFIKSTNNFIGLIDLNQQKLYLIKKTNNGTEINITGPEPVKEFKAKNAVWDKNEKQLLIYDDFEISTYNSETNKENFINRYGQVIKKADWYPDLYHIIILFENNLQILDLYNENSSRNVTEVVKFDQLNNFYLDFKGEIIYFNGKIGKQSGLYLLKIR